MRPGIQINLIYKVISGEVMSEYIFVKSAIKVDQYPIHDQPEVSLVGRSNVGKSSFINALAGKSIAKTSGKPGRTQTINFYNTNQGFWFVDLPGYGYAAVSKKVQSGFAPMIEAYFDVRKNHSGTVHLIDGRIGPTSLDMDMKEYLLAKGLPMVFVATKWDQVKPSEQVKRKKHMEELLKVQVIPFSAVKDIGRKEVMRFLLSWSKG
jgi:GTP-binding protein